MNEITVQLETGNPYLSGSTVSLDINGGRRHQLGFNIKDYVRVRSDFDENAAEFAYFTSVIYGCERAVKRETLEGDRWTREFVIKIPVAEPEKWTETSSLLSSMLEFLTGDVWHLDFRVSPIPLFDRNFKESRNNFRRYKYLNGEAVSLFSGGLDSLIGIINWLEENPSDNIVLASTYDSQAESSKTDQIRILSHLNTSYDGRIQYFVARTGLINGGEDTNFRSRSLAYIGNAILAASFLGKNASIMIPENGAIALNFPLTPARRGSLSTRTVHPHFISMLSRLLGALGFTYQLNNPYHLKTKGEMMQECRNLDILRSAYSDSASCGKRGHKENWENKNNKQCGACVPCIFRRAAINHVGYPSEQFGYSLTHGEALKRLLSHPNHDLVSVIDFVERNDSIDTIWQTLRSNGCLEFSHKDEYTSLIVRLRAEVKNWLEKMEII